MNKNEHLEVLYTIGLTAEIQAYWEAHFVDYELGRVSAQHRNIYKLIGEAPNLTGTVAGKLQYELTDKGQFPAVGDWVAYKNIDGQNTIIHGVLPRKSSVVRKVAGNRSDEQVLATNVDKIFITQALNGDFNLRRLERYINIAWESGAMPVVILTKADLCEDIDEKLIEVQSVTIGIEVIIVSALEGIGIEQIKAAIGTRETIVFIGSSGVGKSTLVNKLLGEEVQMILGVDEHDKGRHTTTYRELFKLPTGGIIIDTPGMRELQLSGGDIEATFQDIESLALKCRFADCQHKNEPGCAIREEINSGELLEERYNSYVKLKREIIQAALRRESKDRMNQKKAMSKMKPKTRGKVDIENN